MDKKKIIIDVPFNIDFTDHFRRDHLYGPNTQIIFNSNFHKTQQKDWIDYRIKIFMDYTGKSFINQTNQNFLALIRYNEPTEGMILEAIANYPKLPDNIKFVTNKEANKIIDEVMEENDYLYHVNIDSDNMYAPDFIDNIDRYLCQDYVECLLCHEGYLYETTTNRLAIINHYSPSAYVYMYNKTTYKQYFELRLFEAHGNAQHHINIPLEGVNYMIVVHEKNLDNQFEFIKNWLGDGTTIEGEEKESILKAWNIVN